MLNKYYKYLPWLILGAIGFLSVCSSLRSDYIWFILPNNHFYDCRYSFIVLTWNLFKI